MVGWLRSLFSLLILAALAGLAWWGHHTGWNFIEEAPAAGARAVADVVANGSQLRFLSAEAVTRAGLEFASVYPGALEESLSLQATTAYDATLQARLATLATGSVWQVRKQVGDTVKAGDVLALIEAPEAGRARTDFVQAGLQVGVRTRTLETLQRGASVTPEGRLREAETSLKEAQVRFTAARRHLASLGLTVAEDSLAGLSTEQMTSRLRFLGLSSSLAAGLAKETTTACLLPLVAPFDGEILTCDAVPGEVVESGRVLFVLADPRRLWLRLTVRPEDAGRVRAGQKVRFQDSTGEVARVDSRADTSTRTVEALAVLDNTDGKLRAGVPGRARLLLRTEPEALLVPREAILNDSEGTFVLVRDRKFRTADEKILRLRRIRTGTIDGEQVEVSGGLVVDEVVVTKGAARLFDATRRNLATRSE